MEKCLVSSLVFSWPFLSASAGIFWPRSNESVREGLSVKPSTGAELKFADGASRVGLQIRSAAFFGVSALLSGCLNGFDPVTWPFQTWILLLARDRGACDAASVSGRLQLEDSDRFSWRVRSNSKVTGRRSPNLAAQRTSNYLRDFIDR